MSRKRIYHDAPFVFLSHRTYAQQRIFKNQREAQSLIGTLTYYEQINYYSLVTYCVMDNHYHAVLRRMKQKTLTQILHAIHSSFAHQYGESHGLRRVWNRRPWVIWLNTEEMLQQKIAYTLLNPWRAGKVQNPMDPYPYSDIDAWKAKKGEAYLHDLFAKNSRQGE